MVTPLIFRTDGVSSTSRPFGGMAVFSRVEFLPGYPRCHNINGIEITIMKVMILPRVTIIGIYRSPRIPVQQLLAALSEVLMLCSSQFNIFVGDFNINWLDEANRRPLYNLFINENNYRQLVYIFTGKRQNADPRSMDYLRGPGPWTTLVDHGPLLWTTLVDHLRKLYHC